MKSRWIVVPLGIALLFAAKGLQAAKEDEAKKEKEFKATCPVSGKPAGESHMVQLKNGDKVYFCCDNCPKAFAKNPRKYDLQVHRQLLETGQIKQVACPVTGKPVNKDTMENVPPAQPRSASVARSARPNSTRPKATMKSSSSSSPTPP